MDELVERKRLHAKMQVEGIVEMLSHALTSTAGMTESRLDVLNEDLDEITMILEAGAYHE